MVVFKNNDDNDRLILTTGDFEARPATTLWTRSRYVTVLSVSGCLLTSLLAVVTTVSVYSTWNNSTDQSEWQFVSLHED